MTPLSDAPVVLVQEDHTYYVEVDGETKQMPPLSRVLAKVGMVPVYGDDIHPAVLAKAAARGTAVHKAIENLFHGKPFELDKAHFKYIDNFDQICQNHSLVTESVEKSLYNPVFDYCCTIDWIGTVDDKPALIDWKTTSKIHWQVGFQLSGQALCFREGERLRLYAGDLRTGTLHFFDPLKFSRVTKQGLQHYNDILELEDEFCAEG